MTETERIAHISVGLLASMMLLCACGYHSRSDSWRTLGTVLTIPRQDSVSSSYIANGHDARLAGAKHEQPLLGELEPGPGVLASGTVTITLSLTTTVPADCRWSNSEATPYEQMPNNFEHGQGEVNHSTQASGFHDLDDVWFYVRCADTAGLIDPDSQEAHTHLRVLGPWGSGFPRIANLWANYEVAVGLDFYSGYDLLIPNWWPHEAASIPQLRAQNPNAKILHSQNATYGWPETDELTAEWWQSQPGDSGYPCLLRDSKGDILLVRFWEHPMYNLTRPECRSVLIRRNVEQFLTSDDEAGHYLVYDGIFWDLLKGSISWLGEDIDSDLDGQPDDAAQLDAAYQFGVKDFLAQVRGALPNAILMGNEASTAYARWVNGRMFEWQLWTLLNGESSLTWHEVLRDYDAWSEIGQLPRTTFIQGAPISLVGPDGDRKYDPMPPAMKAEAAADYRRMRFGLTTALMSDGLFYFQYEPTRGHSWWYDEFGATAGQEDAPLPRGYLGYPTSEAELLVDQLQTPSQIENGDFANGLERWGWWVDSGAGVVATVRVDPTGGIEGTPAALVEVQRAAAPWSVLVYQRDIETTADEFYTLSFWARSEFTRTVRAKVAMAGPPGTDYGFNRSARITQEWQRFVLTDDVSVTAFDGELDLMVGDSEGRLWLDDIQFQSGSLGVWARSFDNGLAVINTTREAQAVPLPGTYCKLNANQAPLFQTRVDDDEALASEGWRVDPASNDQFGRTVYRTVGGTPATVTYRPNLVYEEAYHVLAWVAPESALSRSVSVAISHAAGETVVTLDQSTGEPGWRDLGGYLFPEGRTASAVLSATGEGDVVADAFKWVSVARYNDGARISEITLQPQDGIILLTDCPDEPEQRHFHYLPLVEVR